MQKYSGKHKYFKTISILVSLDQTNDKKHQNESENLTKKLETCKNTTSIMNKTNESTNKEHFPVIKRDDTNHGNTITSNIYISDFRQNIK